MTYAEAKAWMRKRGASERKSPVARGFEIEVSLSGVSAKAMVEERRPGSYERAIASAVQELVYKLPPNMG